MMNSKNFQLRTVVILLLAVSPIVSGCSEEVDSIPLFLDSDTCVSVLGEETSVAVSGCSGAAKFTCSVPEKIEVEYVAAEGVAGVGEIRIRAKVLCKTDLLITDEETKRSATLHIDVVPKALCLYPTDYKGSGRTADGDVPLFGDGHNALYLYSDDTHRYLAAKLQQRVSATPESRLLSSGTYSIVYGERDSLKLTLRPDGQTQTLCYTLSAFASAADHFQSESILPAFVNMLEDRWPAVQYQNLFASVANEAGDETCCQLETGFTAHYAEAYQY